MKYLLIILALIATQSAQAQIGETDSGEMLNDIYLTCGDLGYSTMDPGIEFARYQTPTMQSPEWSFSYGTKFVLSTGGIAQNLISCGVNEVVQTGELVTFKGDHCEVTLKDKTVKFNSSSEIPNCRTEASTNSIVSLMKIDLKNSKLLHSEVAAPTEPNDDQ